MKLTLIAIQDQYISTVNIGIARWSHRKNGGHADRIKRGAFSRARISLRTIGFNDSQIRQIIQDASEVALLERFEETETNTVEGK